MAWNPSPEVQVARDAAAAIGRIKKSKVERCVVMFTMADQMGYASYGVDAAFCAEARRMADVSFAAICDAWDDIDRAGIRPRVCGKNPDWDGLKAEVIEKIDLLRASFEKMADGPAKDLYMRDIGFPLVEVLARFCMSFDLEPVRED